MAHFTRREFVRSTVLGAAALQLASQLRAQSDAVPPVASPLKPGVAPSRWLDADGAGHFPGCTWGVAWPRGMHAAGTTFALRADDGSPAPVQSWPLATWPDGSLKWTAHALPPGKVAKSYEVFAGTPATPAKALHVEQTADAVTVDTGAIVCRLGTGGSQLVERITRDGVEVARRGRLVCLREDRADPERPHVEDFESAIAQVTVEQAGPVRAVVKIEGRHARVGAGASPRAWLPFVVRLYFYAGGETIRMLHTIVHDGDENQDFIRGLGVRFEVPLRGELHDRHVRFSGQGDGLFAEAVRGITGLRRDPGKEVREAQLAGAATPPVSAWRAPVPELLKYVAAYADWTLFQSSADGFEIRKRTKAGRTWLTAARGQRAGGLAYVGTPGGGLAVGVRNFWQSYPGQLDVRGATSDAAELTAWLWAPEAAAMDLRGYHDGLGQDTHEKQLQGLEITYEDYEPGFDKPEGVARTSELFLFPVAATPSREQLAACARAVRAPALLVTTPEHLHRCGVFGGLWSPLDRSTPAKAQVEDRLDWLFKFYEQQREERRWYGFWNYGDVMHTYDADRHEWRYDVGGYAWDNSELSTDLWLWFYFLRTGRADVFRFAEAMTRHTGEVDVHHLGRFAPLGSRHNVLHWGCSAKQLRISTAVNRRFYYYLTGDERVGDLMREQIEAARALTTIQANRKVAKDRVTAPDPNAKEVYVGFGTDWGSLAGAWLTEWERTGDARMRERLVASMKTIAAQPQGFFTGGARMELASGAFAESSFKKPNVSHLSAVFGLVEVCAELVQLLPEVPEFKTAWLDYCRIYNATRDEQAARFGAPLSGIGLEQGHSRLTAFAAKQTGDAALAARAWREFLNPPAPGRGRNRLRNEAQLVPGPAVLRAVHEAAGVSTNDTAQWGLAAMQCLALVGDQMPRE
ncbi:MAG: Tat pathway signal sequence domain protein [Opitutae bacterium]|nr:Tat pathway signal sequence domain protein [Opitutae bacterium]